MVAAGAGAIITGAGFQPGPLHIQLNGVKLDTVLALSGEFSTSITLPAAAAPGLAMLQVCAPSTCAAAPSPGSNNLTTTVRILPRLSDVPSAVVRRALDFLASTRSDEPAWQGAFLDDVVTPYFRPDIAGAAYYEFAVKVGGPAGDLASGEPAPALDAGYLVLSAAEHDFPIAAWSPSRPPPARDLQVRADGQMVTPYKLAMLHMAGEGADGRLVVAEHNNPMLRIAGLDQIDLAALDGGFIYESPADPDAVSAGVLMPRGSFAITPTGLAVDAWPSWEDLKAGYGAAYAPLLTVKRQHAAPDWQVQRNLERNGIGLLPGEVYSLTHPGAPRVAVTGPGTPLVQMANFPGVLRIAVTAAIQNRGVPFSVTLDYGRGLTEAVRFIVADRVVRNPIYAPIAIRPMAGGSAQDVAASSSDVVVAAAASPDARYLRWERHFTPLPPVWDQLAPNEEPNASECPSGCAATAWATLFGFIDRQASVGDSSWARQWGLYRQDGGIATRDAVAPLYFRQGADDGGAISADGRGVARMLSEIRDDLGTRCVGAAVGAASGMAGAATWPWDMDGALRYANRRGSARISAEAGHSWAINEWEHVWRMIEDRRTPSLVMAGALGDGTLHYAVAYGARAQMVRECRPDRSAGYVCEEKMRNAQFYLNPGWGTTREFGWYPASTGFYAQVYPR